MPSLTERAERALLGALLLEPRQAAMVPRVEIGDFTDQRQGEFFAAVRDAAGPDPRTARTRLAELDADPAYLNLLRYSCPDPSHATAYARMVVEAALRRQLAVHADRLEQAAANLHYDTRRLGTLAQPGGTADYLLTSELPSAGGQPRHPGLPRIFGHELILAQALRAHATAFDPGQDSSPAGTSLPDLPQPEPVADSQVLSPALAVWRAARAARTSQQDGRAELEEQALAGIVQQHEATRDVPGWLPAAAFSTGPRQELLRALTSLHSRGEPVDALTADWERARISQDTDTSYAARLTRLTVDTTRVLDSCHQIYLDYQNSPQARTAPAAGNPAVADEPHVTGRVPSGSAASRPDIGPPPCGPVRPGPAPRI
jgi:DnaB-like helicase N terminal domain